MKTTRLYVCNLGFRLLPESRCFGLKVAMLRWAGAKIGKNVRIYSSATFLGTGALDIGDDVHIGPRAMIYPVAPAGVKIGSHVDVAPDVLILTGSHRVDPAGAHVAGEGTTASVEIGDGCWLGARSVILPGVVLSARTVVAAGAVVTESVQKSVCLLAGVPASVKRCYVS